MHAVRRTEASLMVASGIPILDVARMPGQSAVAGAGVMRYAHFAPTAGRSAIDALNRKLRPPEAPKQVSEGLHPYRRDSPQLPGKMQ